MSRDLEGRVAVVTGGADGIGKTVAERLAVAGADIAVADINDATETKKLVEASGRQFLSAICDVSDESQVEDFAGKVRERFGGVDIVVNNAGIAHMVNFENTSLELWSKTFAVNVTGYFLVVKAFLADLKASRAGRLINMSSTIYYQGPATMSAYVASKGAINGFTHVLASELGPHNVTVNAVAPHLLWTGLTRDQLPGAVFDQHVGHQNIQRAQTPEDVANMVNFLASDEASFITGQIHIVDGGIIRR